MSCSRNAIAMLPAKSQVRARLRFMPGIRRESRLPWNIRSSWLPALLRRRRLLLRGKTREIARRSDLFDRRGCAVRLRLILQQEHVVAAIERRGRTRLRRSEETARIRADRKNLADRKSGRESPAESRRDEPVADLHVGTDRNVRQLEPIDRAGAVRDRAQTRALDHDRDRMRRI